MHNLAESWVTCHYMHISTSQAGLTAEQLGHRIRQARQLAGLSQGQLAQVLACDQSTISRLEDGRGLTSDLLARIAAATNQQVDFFLRAELPLAVLLRAENRSDPSTAEAVQAFSRFVADYEFLLSLERES